MTVLSGPNAGGKSSVKDAIEMLLTGAARTTDKAGRGFQSLITAGRPAFSITGIIEVAGKTYTVTRSKSRDGGHSFDVRPAEGEPWSGGIKVQERALWQVIGADDSVIRACLHANHLPRMSPDSQEALFFSVMALTFTLDDIERLTIEAGAESDDIPYLAGGPDAWFLAAYGPDKCANNQPFPPTIFDEAHDYVYEKRRQTNRDLKEAQHRVLEAEKAFAGMAAAHPDFLDAGQDVLDGINDRLAGLRADRDRVVADVASIDSKTELRAQLTARLEELHTERSALEQWYARVDEATGSGDLDGQIEVLERTQADGRRGVLTYKAEVAALEEAINAFSGDTPACPLSGLLCPLDAAAQVGIVKKLRAEQKKAQGKLVALEDSPFDAETALLKLRALRDTMSDRTFEQVDADTEKTDGKLAGVAEIPVANTLAVQKATLEQRIEKGAGRLAAVSGFLAAQKRAADARTAAGALAEAHERYDRLVKALGPGGAKLIAVNTPLVDMEDRINERLRQYSEGYEIRIERDEGFALLAKVPDAEGGLVPVGQLSTSEQLRVGIALQDALTNLTGFRFLLADNLDMLVMESRSMLGAALSKWSPDYDGIVMIASGDVPPNRDAPEPDVDHDGSVRYWIEHGAAEVWR